ncbi:hypothetical protein AAVH_08084 [Aphelenchoides avenae]|nr:hypothetical protein AAVH_08084 [Aphelenchus avenae]
MTRSPLALQSTSKQSTKPRKRTGNEPARRSKATGGLSGRYNEEGVENYYARVAETYRNPHEREVHAALQVAFKDRDYEARILGHTGKEKKDSRILDLACGSGEVTLCLRDKLDWPSVDGMDPFTSDAYAARTGHPAEAVTFMDISNGALDGRQWDLVICSYALHLAPAGVLPTMCLQMALCSPFFVIISPHKLPVMKDEYGWTLEDEFVHERVHIRLFKSAYL